jgi:hypothetical protein
MSFTDEYAGGSVKGTTERAGGLTPRVGDRIGYPTVLFSGTEDALFERILCLKKKRG